jgi:hypothetical protein
MFTALPPDDLFEVSSSQGVKIRTHKDLLTTSVAWYSECETYRYMLARTWADGPRLNYLMLNPSKATERDNDPTVERCQRRTARLGYGGFSVTNLFALRETDPAIMRRHIEPIGPANDAVIKIIAGESSQVICAWGNDGDHLGRAADVLKFLREICPEKLMALKITDLGHPYHPLYVAYSTVPQPFSR